MAKSKTDKNGWVKISRSVQQNFLWKEEDPFDRRSAWVDLILLANHEPGEIRTRNGETIKIPIGSHYTSIRKLADRWHWSKDKVRRFLATLTATQMITQTATQNGTLLTLVKYRDFQSVRDTKQDAERDTNRHTGKTQTRMIYKNDIQESYSGAKKGRPVSVADTIAALEEWAKEEE